MRCMLACLILICSGCVHDPQIPPEWDRPGPYKSYTGLYLNRGQINEASAARGFNLRKLTGFFWPDSGLDADTVKLTEYNGLVEIIAFKGQREIAKKTIGLTNGELLLEKAGSDAGGIYKTIDRFSRNERGLIVESIIVSAGFYILPLAGKDKAWYFYTIIQKEN